MLEALGVAVQETNTLTALVKRRTPTLTAALAGEELLQLRGS